MVGPIVAALGQAAIQLGTNYLSGKLAKKQTKGAAGAGGGISDFMPQGFNAGGIRTSFDPGTGFRVSTTPERQGLISNTANLFRQQGSDLKALGQKFTPGFNEMLRARLNIFDPAARAGIGNLREGFARRRLAGSSFASNAVAQAEAENLLKRDQIVAENYITSLAMTSENLAKQYDAQRAEFGTRLGELNLQAEIAAKLSGIATETLGKLAVTNASLEQFYAGQEAEAAQGIGAIINPISGAIFDRFKTKPNNPLDKTPATTSPWTATTTLPSAGVGGGGGGGFFSAGGA